MKKVVLFILMFVGMMNVEAISKNNVDYLTKNIVSNNYDRTQARYLQKELNMVMNCDLDTDGIIGNLTKNCIKKFQAKYNLEVDGLVGPITRNKLNALYGANKGIVSTASLNVRNKPGTNGTTILGTVSKGNILTILGQQKVNSTVWYYIQYGDMIGYVSSVYVKTTFVEVDIISQTLRLYKNTKLILDTPVTTGKADGVHDTNRGYFEVVLMQTDRYLQPSNSYVRYWVRFYWERALGIHDADWRGMDVNFNYFGGTVYKNMSATAGSRYTGSHGCVNVPVPKMPTIYATLSYGAPVYVH